MTIQTPSEKNTSPKSFVQIAALEQEQPTKSLRLSSLRYDALLVLVTIIWGGTFLITKNAITLSGPFTYLALCYSIATLTLAVIFHKRLWHITRFELLSGLIIGLFLFTGYTLQTVGLSSTSVSKAGFITGMYVPLVPILSFVLWRQKPGRKAIAGVLLSVLGLCLLSINNTFSFTFGLGETLMLGCAIAFALQIVAVGKFAPAADAFNLTIVPLALTAILSFFMIPITGEAFIMPSLPVWGAVVFMGIVDIAFTFLMMNYIQQFVSSTRAALIYALEPLWATFFGYLLAGDVLSAPAWLGCGCILLGMLVGIIRAK